MRTAFIGVVLLLAAAAWAGYFFLGGLAEDEPMRQARLFNEQVAALQPKADAGDAAALIALGDLYRTGPKDLRDLARAVALYREAARQGHPDARFRLGRLHEAGEGVERDVAAAIRWYELAAQAGGHAGAEFALGDLYFHGRGVAQDHAEALAWFRRAAEQGHPGAQMLMGRMYQYGWGVGRDAIKAYMWYTLAMRASDATAGWADAMPDAGSGPAEARDELARTMNRSQIDVALGLADAWRPTR